MTGLLVCLPLLAILCATILPAWGETVPMPAPPITAGEPSDFADAQQWIRRGLQFNGSGRYQEAIEAFSRAVVIEPDNSFAYFNLGTAAALLGRYNEAAGYLRQAVRISPDLIPAWSNLGAMYNHLSQPRQALEAFRQVLRLSPADANARYQCGLALLSLGETAAARAEYEALKPLDPTLAAQLLSRLKPD